MARVLQVLAYQILRGRRLWFQVDERNVQACCALPRL